MSPVTFDPSVLLPDLRNYLVTLGIVRTPAVAGSLPPLWLDPKKGVPYPGQKEGLGPNESNDDLVLGAYPESGIPSKPFEGFYRQKAVTVFIRGRTSPLIQNLYEDQLYPALHDQRNYNMGGLQVNQSMVFRDLHRVGADQNGYVSSFELLFDVWTPDSFEKVTLPSQLPGIQLWTRTDSLVLADNAPVPLWHDESANSNDLVQTSAPNRPTYKATGMNGRPSVHFDQSSSVQGLSAATIPQTQPTSNQFTISVVAKFNAAPSSFQGPLIMQTPVAGNWGGGGWAFVLYGGLEIWEGNHFSGARIVQAPASGVHVWTAQYDGSRLYGYLDGFPFSEQLAQAGVANMPPGFILVGSDGTNSTYCDLGEIIMWNRMLVNIDRIGEEQYLIKKWGIK